MVFNNLPASEKEAFFGLLDEYFASRPDVFPNLNTASNSNNPVAAKAAVSAIHNAFTKESPVPAWKRQNNDTSPQPSNETELPSSVGRVAAAAASFKFSSPGQGAGPPRPPARNLSSSFSSQPDNDEASSASLSPRIPGNAAKLVAQKKFGDVDLSSGKNMYLSIRHGTANKTAPSAAVAPPVPAAFPPKKNAFAPPPVRRVSSVSNQENEVRASPPAPPPPPRPRQEEPEEQGDWAEALYDYSSEDPGDLELQAGQRVLIVERTSDDWWTGEYEGRRGLVPAAYVKMF
ncbi:hypothetical protein PHLCEN_2v2234 [Hermanssonia centrifuga]|uniref:SH3 domain-containing protein n=1 Tax=Hermanssonia centrifuga TaxID=98765 RepID=A0A2R6RPP1_9APHY|nr:hypothetical protein PHLCEN_2v2234 [Hermanssonia centrifuga]